MLNLSHLSYAHVPGGTPALSDVSLSVDQGEFVAVVGPSGCGKTTLLRLAGGLLPVQTGSARMDGLPVTGPRADCGVVFQHCAALPWKSVRDNVAFGLELRGQARSEIDEAVERVLSATGLSASADRLPATLSGGMLQRLALARTLVTRPRLLLLDEPFGALDPLTRTDMQELLARLWEENKPTVLLVTHDLEEAAFLADRVLLLSPQPGRLKTDLRVPLPRPRRHELRTSPELYEVKRRLLGLLESPIVTHS